MKLNKEYIFLYYLRILACVSVIALHVAGFSPAAFNSGHMAEWWTRNLIVYFSIWSVQGFVMLSGALLLSDPQNESTLSFYQRKLPRVILPAILWIPFFYFFVQNPQAAAFPLPKIISDMLIEGRVGHLYYLFIALELYLLTPLFRELKKKLSDKAFIYLTLFFFVISFIWKPMQLAPTFFIGYLGYYLAGSILLPHIIRQKRTGVFGLGFLLSGLLLALLVYLFNVENLFQRREVLYRHNNPLVILMTVCIFMAVPGSRLIKKIFDHISLSFLRQLSATTLGIYILHPLILKWVVELLVYLGFSSPNLYLPWYLYILLIPMVFILTFYPVFLVRKVKILGYFL